MKSMEKDRIFCYFALLSTVYYNFPNKISIIKFHFAYYEIILA